LEFITSLGDIESKYQRYSFFFSRIDDEVNPHLVRKWDRGCFQIDVGGLVV